MTAMSSAIATGVPPLSSPRRPLRGRRGGRARPQGLPRAPPAASFGPAPQRLRLTRFGAIPGTATEGCRPSPCWLGTARVKYLGNQPAGVERGMVYVLAAAAALTGAAGGVLQRIGVESAPSEHAMRLSLLAYALRRGTWVLGFALLLVTFGLQASALRFGDL